LLGQLLASASVTHLNHALKLYRPMTFDAGEVRDVVVDPDCMRLYSHATVKNYLPGLSCCLSIAMQLQPVNKVEVSCGCVAKLLAQLPQLSSVRISVPTTHLYPYCGSAS